MSTGCDNPGEPIVGIRIANRDDVQRIHRLLAELAAVTGQARKFTSSENDLRAFGFSENPAFEVLLAEQGNDVLGLTLFFYNYSSWRGELGAYLQDIVVQRTARGRGIGTLLLRATARRAKERGATHLRLSVERDNDDAIAFYRSEGLSACDNECLFQADGTAFAALAGKP